MKYETFGLDIFTHFNDVRITNDVAKKILKWDHNPRPVQDGESESENPAENLKVYFN